MTDRKEFDPAEYWERRLGARYSLAGVGHAGLPHSYNRWLYRVRRRVFGRLLERVGIDVDGARVLDVGSGTGFYIERWKEAGAAALHGMDISATAVDNLRRRFPDATFHRGDIGAPDAGPRPAGSFDVVSAMDVMFHIVDDRAFQRAIRNVHSALGEGGWFIFSDNFLHRPERRLPHIVHRPLEDVRAVLEAAGFEVVERRPMFVLMNVPVDSDSRFLLGLWSLLSRTVRQGEALGWLAGAVLYPIELALVTFRDESPTTEVMVCRKRAGASHAVE